MTTQRPQAIRFKSTGPVARAPLHTMVAHHSNGIQRLRLPPQSLGFDRLQRLGATLLIIDGENINYTLSSSGWHADYGALVTRLESICQTIDPHVFATAEDNMVERVKRYFAATGIAPHIRYIESVQTANGASRCANSDNELLLQLGFLCAKQQFDTVILATGDGALGCSALNFLAELRKPPRVYTCSVMGATSNRLLTENNGLVNGNLWLGQDLLRTRTGLKPSDLLH